jgi:hypothetical protein
MPKAKMILSQEPKLIKAEIFGWLSQGDFSFVLSNKLIGPDAPGYSTLAETELHTRRIVLSTKENTLDEMVTTVIHEILHLLVPARLYDKIGDAKVEARIRSLVPKVRAVFAPTEISQLLRFVFKYVKWDE